MSTIVDFAIFPMDKGISVSAYVARAAAVIAESGLAHATGPMGTCIEGDWDAVMAVVSRCMAVLREDSDRIYATIKVDYRRGTSGRLEGKLASLARHMT